MPRKKKKIVTEEKKEVVVVKKKRRRRKRGNTHSALIAKAGYNDAFSQKQLDNNARSYFASLKNPFTVTNARRPRAAFLPSATGSMVERYQMNSVDCSGTNDRILYALYWPRMKFFRGFVNAAVNNDSVTWAATVDSKAAAGLATSSWRYRTTSVGIRWKFRGAYLNRGGTVYVGLVQWSDGGAISTTPITDYVTSNNGIVSYDLAKVGPEGLQAIWLPGMPELSVSATITVTPSGITFRDPGATTVADNMIFMGIVASKVGASGSGEDIGIEVETVYNYEHIPYQNNAYNFGLGLVPGSNDALAIVEMQERGNQPDANLIARSIATDADKKETIGAYMGPSFTMGEAQSSSSSSSSPWGSLLSGGLNMAGKLMKGGKDIEGLPDWAQTVIGAGAEMLPLLAGFLWDRHLFVRAANIVPEDATQDLESYKKWLTSLPQRLFDEPRRLIEAIYSDHLTGRDDASIEEVKSVDVYKPVIYIKSKY